MNCLSTWDRDSGLSTLQFQVLEDGARERTCASRAATSNDQWPLVPRLRHDDFACSPWLCTSAWAKQAGVATILSSRP